MKFTPQYVTIPTWFWYVQCLLTGVGIGHIIIKAVGL